MEKIRKYIDDVLFVRWVYEPNDDLDAYWNLYLKNHPDEKNTLLSLKKELQSFKIINQKLTEGRKKDLSNRIVEKIQQRQRVKRLESIGKYLLKYAAIAFLFSVIGGTLVYFNPKQESIFENARYFDIPGMKGNPTLLLSDGSKINLESSQPEIKFIPGNKVVINKDSIVALPESTRIPNQLIIPYGSRGRIVLSDQSVVWLNAGSRLIFPSAFTGKEREVVLFGEAFFEIEKNKHKPFVVNTNDFRIRVLGTKFNVSAYLGDDVSQTVLTQGRIELELKNKGWFNKRISLNPDELFSYSKETKKTKVQKIQPDKYVLWRTGVVTFEGENLSKVIKEVERFYDIQIKLENPLDGNIRFDGKLNLKDDKYEVLYYITKVANLKFEKENERYFVIR